MPPDSLTKEARSERMSRIRSVNTKAEIVVRHIVNEMGIRYQLHAKELPGRPDLAFNSKKCVIFVNGCFWHQHNCGHYKMPKSRTEYWLPKLKKNIQRDRQNIAELKNGGWKVLVIWECELREEYKVRRKIQRFLTGNWTSLFFRLKSWFNSILIILEKI